MNLTRLQIENMPAYPGMDALISEHIIGARVMPAGQDFYERREDRSWEDMPHYSLDIAAAWEVFERFNWWLEKGDGWYAVYTTEEVNKATCPDGQFSLDSCLASAESAPLAICRAALLTLLA